MRVVEVSGLASIIGKGTVRRALKDIGSTPEVASPQVYRHAMPALRARMSAFFGPEELEAATLRIEKTLQEE